MRQVTENENETQELIEESKIDQNTEGVRFENSAVQSDQIKSSQEKLKVRDSKNMNIRDSIYSFAQSLKEDEIR